MGMEIDEEESTVHVSNNQFFFLFPFLLKKLISFTKKEKKTYETKCGNEATQYRKDQIPDYRFHSHLGNDAVVPVVSIPPHRK